MYCLLTQLSRMSHLIGSKRYERIDFLGEGTFATVYKAKDLADNGRIVAIKKIKLGNRTEARDGLNRTALREIKLMQELRHTNVIELIDVFGQKSNISLVLPFMETDLEGKPVTAAIHFRF